MQLATSASRQVDLSDTLASPGADVAEWLRACRLHTQVKPSMHWLEPLCKLKDALRMASPIIEVRYT